MGLKVVSNAQILFNVSHVVLDLCSIPKDSAQHHKVSPLMIPSGSYLLLSLVLLVVPFWAYLCGELSKTKTLKESMNKLNDLNIYLCFYVLNF